MNKLVEQLQQLQEKKWKRWTEAFEDEDTHEMVDIERKELLTTKTSDKERELWMQIIPELPKLSVQTRNTIVVMSSQWNSLLLVNSLLPLRPTVATPCSMLCTSASAILRLQ